MQDVNLAGTFVPKGVRSSSVRQRLLAQAAQTTVLITNWTMHHNERNYPDPDRFDPDRWINKSDKVDLEESFTAFGIGPRACIGRKCVSLSLALT